jgi:hypothetical protein
VRIAQSLGNQLHVVWVKREPGYIDTVWYAHGTTTAPAVKPQELPTPSAYGVSITSGQTQAATIVPTIENFPRNGSQAASPAISVLIGTILALVVIGAFMIYYWIKVIRR